MPVNFETDTEVREWELAPMGVYDCRLVDVQVQEKVGQFGPFKQYVWIFETLTAKTSTGDTFQFRTWTPAKWGDRLESWVNQLAGRKVTADEFKKMKVEKLQTCVWAVMVKIEPDSKGVDRNNIAGISLNKAAGNINPADYVKAPQNATGSQQGLRGNRTIPAPPGARHLGESVDDESDPFE